MTKLEERIIAITNSILSGDNECGTIAKALQDGTLGDFIQQMIRPTLEIYEDEYNQLRAENDRLSRENQNKRFALECVLSNEVIDNPVTKQAVKAAMPGHPLAERL